MFGLSSSALFVGVFAIGYLCFSLFRLFLTYRLRRERKEYEEIIESKMKDMKQDLKQRAIDLQESMEMINHEYSGLMKSMSKQTRHSAEELNQKLNEYKQKMKPPAPGSKLTNQVSQQSVDSDQPAPPSSSNDDDAPSDTASDGQ